MRSKPQTAIEKANDTTSPAGAGKTGNTREKR
jgi:hypothetical protein